MNHITWFEYLFESIEICREIVWWLFLFKYDIDLFTECGNFKSEKNCLCMEIEKKLMEQN